MLSLFFSVGMIYILLHGLSRASLVDMKFVHVFFVLSRTLYYRRLSWKNLVFGPFVPLSRTVAGPGPIRSVAPRTVAGGAEGRRHGAAGRTDRRSVGLPSWRDPVSGGGMNE